MALFAAVSLAANPGPAVADAAVGGGEAGDLAGVYCPGMASTYLILEELTVAVEAVARARESFLTLKDPQTGQMLLARADAALASALGRGSGARVAALANAVMATKEDGDVEASLAWYPALKRALAGLPFGAARDAAITRVSEAEAILQGEAEGDDIQVLLGARRLLECDSLHIPMREALARLEHMYRDAGRGAFPTPESFETLLEHLNGAMTYGLQRLIDLEQT
jgi:hypothetical protein